MGGGGGRWVGGGGAQHIIATREGWFEDVKSIYVGEKTLPWRGGGL